MQRTMIEHEARHLLAMANEIILSRPESAADLSEWRQKVFALLSDTSRRSIIDEAELDRLSLEMRTIWMQIAHDHTGHHLKSPLVDETVILPLGQTHNLQYERLFMPRALERRCKSYRPQIRGWASSHLLFRSGMAAISSIIQNIQAFFFSHGQRKIMVDFFGGYFETQRVFDLHGSSLLTFRRHAAGSDLYDAVAQSDGDVLFFEPVSYDWDMEVVDLDILIASIGKRRRALDMIVVDTTIVGDRFPMQKFLSALPRDAAPIIAHISSGLKLDQEGLELANVGIVTLYCRQVDPIANTAEKFFRQLSGHRKVNGTGLSTYEAAALDVPWFLNINRFSEHCRAVFENNIRLAHALVPTIQSNDGIFERVSHPGLSSSAHLSWAVAPFVAIHFKERFDHEDTHQRVLAILLENAAIDGINFLGGGMSFGFRGHRFEIIMPEKILHPNGKSKGLLKIAMGRRKGPMADAVIHLVNSLALLKAEDWVS
jgi:hypothetical protein